MKTKKSPAKKPAAKPAPSKKSTKKGAAAAAVEPATEHVDVAPAEPAAGTEEPAIAPAQDAIDMALARARTLTQPVVQRATGTKPGARLSAPRAVDKLVETLAPAATAPAEEHAQSAATAEGDDDNGGGDEEQPEQPGAEPAATEELVLPPVGTVVVKSDRHGKERVRCVIVAGGIEYAGKTYPSLTAAAMVAQRDLGLTSKTVNGWLFWALRKPAARTGTATRDPLAALNKAWANYLERARTAHQTATGATREQLNEALAHHVGELVSLVSPPAASAA